MRWLTRQQASGLLLPGNDLWSFDAETVVFTHLSGDAVEPGVDGTDLAAQVGELRGQGGQTLA